MRTETINLSAEVEALLSAANLPVADLSRSPGLHLLGVRAEGRLAGVVGIEAYGLAGLLRSLAVVPERRHSGLGKVLVTDAEVLAAEHGIKTLYLLTTTAAGFFTQLGYAILPRSGAPAVITATAQFKGLCPASSTLMRKVLVRDGVPQLLLA